MKMVRKQVYITAAQDVKLKQASRQLGVTEAELIRRGIEMVESKNGLFDAERQAAADRLLSFMRKRAEALPAGGGIDSFDRDEVYAERLERLGRVSG